VGAKSRRVSGILGAVSGPPFRAPAVISVPTSRNGAPFKDWVLPAAMERVRRKLAGADDGNRQMVDILTAALTDGPPAVEPRAPRRSPKAFFGLRFHWRQLRVRRVTFDRFRCGPAKGGIWR
jgi:hypothetical protein